MRAYGVAFRLGTKARKKSGETILARIAKREGEMDHNQLEGVTDSAVVGDLVITNEVMTTRSHTIARCSCLPRCRQARCYEIRITAWRSILPVPVFGNSSMKAISRGYL
jgi:hypothetical protein